MFYVNTFKKKWMKWIMSMFCVWYGIVEKLYVGREEGKLQTTICNRLCNRYNI
jgi:hypothetical protein